MIRRVLGAPRVRNGCAFAILKVALVVIVGLALLQACARMAHAAEPTQRTPCRSTVVWDLAATGGRVDGLPAAVAWAYGQVAEVAGLQVSQGDGNTIEWEHVGWAERTNGNTAPEGMSTRSPLLGPDREIVVHTHDFDDRSTVQMRQIVLRDVLGDLGITSPTSTGKGLSALDRQALAFRCAEPKSSPTSTPSASPTPAPTPSATAVDASPRADASHATDRPAIPAPVALSGIAVLALVVAGLWLPGVRNLGTRAAGVAARARRRSDR